MPPDLDQVLWDLDEEVEVVDEEPSVVVDPALEAFCMMARGSSPPLAEPGRLSLDSILEYIRDHAEPAEP